MSHRIAPATAILLSFSSAMNPACAAAPDEPNARPQCEGKFNLCRYVNVRTGQELIPARFERAMQFSGHAPTPNSQRGSGQCRRE
jgi:hypothetical protein